ncbi:MAG TPA: acetate kinase [Actinospica sp.]|jgi:acetate kinase|nr:acetate kinase [Actinospica sp.]
MKQAVLVLNVGSSSIKYQLLELDTDIDTDSGSRLATGLVDRIGDSEGSGKLTHRQPDAEPYEVTTPFADHEHALAAVLAAFRDAGPDLDKIRLTAVGHRVVHGGSEFTEATVLDEAALAKIRELIPLAPLHNPPNVTGIEAAQRAFPGVPQVAVFDTAFHQTLPPAAHTYAVPSEWRDRYAVRRYGFHGTSHEYVSRRAAAFLGRDLAETNVIVLHLGNGASVSAIEGGRSVETSMGLTPLEGLVMGTRSGDIDPAIPAYLERVAGLDAASVEEALNRKSGLLALAGSNDLRDVDEQADDGDASAQLAIDVYCHRIRKYVGAYYAVLGRVDAIVFTAGVGENDSRIRERSLSGLERLGIGIDPARNDSPAHAERLISPDDAEVAVLVIPTDEEIEIARQALAALTAVSSSY